MHCYVIQCKNSACGWPLLDNLQHLKVSKKIKQKLTGHQNKTYGEWAVQMLACPSRLINGGGGGEGDKKLKPRHKEAGEE